MAGVLGFGLAALSLDPSGQKSSKAKASDGGEVSKRLMLFDNKPPAPVYATLDEMKAVSHEPLCRDSLYRSLGRSCLSDH